ncbi:hypothetical protein JHK87_047574 [Glycine soja]|nr:hypothetical protein JHK87_047574 [Glycine soja]
MSWDTGSSTILCTHLLLCSDDSLHVKRVMVHQKYTLRKDYAHGTKKQGKLPFHSNEYLLGVVCGNRYELTDTVTYATLSVK